jgi:hypothetical protein
MPPSQPYTDFRPTGVKEPLVYHFYGGRRPPALKMQMQSLPPVERKRGDTQPATKLEMSPYQIVRGPRLFTLDSTEPATGSDLWVYGLDVARLSPIPKWVGWHLQLLQPRSFYLHPMTSGHNARTLEGPGASKDDHYARIMGPFKWEWPNRYPYNQFSCFEEPTLGPRHYRLSLVDSWLPLHDLGELRAAPSRCGRGSYLPSDWDFIFDSAPNSFCPRKDGTGIGTSTNDLKGQIGSGSQPVFDPALLQKLYNMRGAKLSGGVHPSLEGLWLKSGAAPSTIIDWTEFLSQLRLGQRSLFEAVPAIFREPAVSA